MRNESRSFPDTTAEGKSLRWLAGILQAWEPSFCFRIQMAVLPLRRNFGAVNQISLLQGTMMLISEGKGSFSTNDLSWGRSRCINKDINTLLNFFFK